MQFFLTNSNAFNNITWVLKNIFIFLSFFLKNIKFLLHILNKLKYIEKHFKIYTYWLYVRYERPTLFFNFNMYLIFFSFSTFLSLNKQNLNNV